MRYAPALLGALVATPAVAVVGLDPAETPRADWLDALPPGLARTAGPALDGPCLGTLRCINIPFLVDESGDTMTGKLTLAPGADLACAECVHPEDVAFGYAHSASKGGKAADAELLDGLDAAQFLRSDQSGVLGGDLAVAGMLRPGGLVLPALGRAALPPPGQPGRVAFMTGAPGEIGRAHV